MVLEAPDDLAGLEVDLDGLGLLGARVAVAEDDVAVRQDLDSGRPGEADALEGVLGDALADLALVHTDDYLTPSEIDTDDEETRLNLKRKFLSTKDRLTASGKKLKLKNKILLNTSLKYQYSMLNYENNQVENTTNIFIYNNLF